MTDSGMTENETHLILAALKKNEDMLQRIDAKLDVFRENFAAHEKYDLEQFTMIKTVWAAVSVVLIGLLEAIRWWWHGGR